MTDTRYTFMTGSVISPLDKGIVAANLGKLLQARRYKVTIQKFDPYVNIDPGTLNPYEHDECHMTEDGHEADLDLGRYEHFLNIRTSRENNITTGRIYRSIIGKERHGDYLGKTVQVTPHVTDEIKRSVRRLDMKYRYDFVITEIGGVVGDIESLPFLESVRQLKWGLKSHCVCIHLIYVPFIAAAKEYRMKPTQHSVKQFQEKGIQPDILTLRTEHRLSNEILDKMALFCNVSKESVFQSIDMPSIYEIPLLLQEQGLDRQVIQRADPEVDETPRLEDWRDFVHRVGSATEELHAVLVGKYVELRSAYKSIDGALLQSYIYHDRKLKLTSIHSKSITRDSVEKLLSGYSGVVVVPGFGSRGVEGKSIALEYTRAHQIPTLGVYLGMQYMAIEFTRNVLGLEGCNTTEIKPTATNKIIGLMNKQRAISDLDASIQLGAYECELKESSKLTEAYGKLLISEKHRYRYEFNGQCRTAFEEAGFKCVGTNPEMDLVEVPELKGHP